MLGHVTYQKQQTQVMGSPARSDSPGIEFFNQNRCRLIPVNGFLTGVQPSIRGYLDPLGPRFLLPVRFASVWDLCTNYKVQLRFLVRCSFGDLAGGGRADSEGTARDQGKSKRRIHIR